jgi:signal peptidase I
LAKARWFDRLTSLWSPPTVFAGLLLVYLVIVESSLCSYLWLQPVIKALGTAAVAWFCGALLLRLVWVPRSAQRKARVRAEELLGELEASMAKKGRALNPKARGELVTGAAELMAQMGEGTGEAIDKIVERLDGLLDKHLPKGRAGSALDFLGGLGKALLVAVLFRSVALDPYKIPSGSMLPTLEIGDQIFVNKFLYGVRLPFINKVPFVLVRKPGRGDVIVFNNPVHEEVDYIKRIIAVPGDVIEVREGVVVLNGIAQPRTPVRADLTVWDQSQARGDWFERQLPLSREELDGAKHWILGATDDPMTANFGPFTVPEGQVFVMGDNRDNSEDSRFGLGGPRVPTAVPYGHIKGKATIIWLALGHGGLFSGLFGGTGFRTDRLFQPLSLCGPETSP